MGDVQNVRPGKCPALVGVCFVGLASLFYVGPALISGSAFAIDWKAKSTLSQRVEVDDNYRVSATNAGNVLASITRLSTSIEAIAPTHRFNIGHSFDLYQYAGPGSSALDDKFNYDDFSVGFTKETKLTTYILGASFKREPTSTTEFDDTGNTTVDADRLTLSANGGVNHRVNARNSLAFDVSARSVTFSPDTGDLVAYFSANSSLAWTHEVNALTSVNTRGSVGYSEFDDDQNSRNLYFSATVGVKRKLTKRLSASLDVGALGAILKEDATMLLPADEESGIGPTVNFSVDYRRKRTNISFSGTQALEPSADGELQSRTSVNLNIDHQIDSQSSVSLGVSASRRGIGKPVRCDGSADFDDIAHVQAANQPLLGCRFWISFQVQR